MPETEPSAGPNADQQTYWNAAVGERWAEFQEQLDAALRPINEQLIARAAPKPGEAVLDVGCGAGATTRALAAEVGPQGAVIGIDISHVLLARAEELRRQAQLAHVRHLHADAQTYAFAPESFDLLTSRFGVMFFADPVAAFGNLLDALRPGGRLALACWTDLPANPWFALPRAVASAVLGESPPTPPRAPGPFAFAETDYVLDILRRAGFADVAAELLEVRLTPRGSLEEVTHLVCSVGPVTSAMRTFDGGPEHLAEITRRIAAALREYEEPAGVRVPARLSLFTARKT